MFRVDDVQGKEFRAVIISTVRTCASDAKKVDEIEMEEGFFTNPKVRLNFRNFLVCPFLKSVLMIIFRFLNNGLLVAKDWL